MEARCVLLIPDGNINFFRIERIHVVAVGDRNGWHETQEVADQIFKGRASNGSGASPGSCRDKAAL